MRVKDILMTKNPKVYAVHPHDQIRQAARLLAEYNIGLVVVLDDQHHMVGVMSERDIVREAVYSEGPLFDKEVQTIMTTEIIVATPDDELEYLSNAMIEKNFRHLPVIEGDQVIGVLSIKDVLKATAVKYEGELHHWRHYATAEADEIQ